MNIVHVLIIMVIVEFITLITLILILYQKKQFTDVDEKEKAIKKKQEWIIALHDKFCRKWIDYFSESKYPLDEVSKGKIIALMWEISSTSIDCLMLESEDPNLLQRHQDSVAYLIGKSTQWNNLKEFHRDPTTVPNQVIAIYDILKENHFKGQLAAFGYKLVLD